jgi:NADH-quinone oxidoreductase subunit N
LAGLPPGLAGLFAKVTIVDALINTGWGWLAGVVALNAVIALAYYLRATAILYAGVGESLGGAVADLRAPRLPVSWPVATALVVGSAFAIVLGFAPQLLFDSLTR